MLHRRDGLFSPRSLVLALLASFIVGCATQSTGGVGGDPEGAAALGADGGVADGSTATTTGGGTKGFAEDCLQGSECQSGICFVGGMQSFCSLACQANEQCPPPPLNPAAGPSCNRRGFCKRD